MTAPVVARMFIGTSLAAGMCGLLASHVAVSAAQAPQRAAAARPPWTSPVPRAECGPKDRVEPALQGQTSIAERATGASNRPYNCNLELVGQFQGEGASWQMAAFDHCAYYGTANNPEQQHKGVVVIDASNPARPVASAYLDVRPMWDPWESLKVNASRKLLAAVQGDRGSGQQAGFAMYDVTDCAHPALKSNVVLSADVKGHAGNFTPDGKTYYGGQIRTSTYPIDVTDPASPKLLGVWPGQEGIGLPHDMSFNPQATRMYTAQPGGPARGGNPATPNGLVISDVSDFQARKATPQVKVLSSIWWDDGSTAQYTQYMQVAGRPYVVVTDEGGSGGLGGGLGDGGKAACARKLPPFGFARIIDVSDERNPVHASKLMLEVHDPANCSKVEPDTNFKDVTGYSAHYCAPDSPSNARYLACSYWEAGVRVFDVRDPYRPKEVAYYKPPATGTANLPGSSRLAYWKGPRTTDWATSDIWWHRNGDSLQLWFTSADNGFQIVRFTNSLGTLGRNFVQNQ